MIKWGLIGCGAVAERKGGPALYGVAGSELTAVMSRDIDKAADFARRHGAASYYDSLQALLADHEVNAIYVATPVSLHASQAIAAIRSGKHVLCEKPMGLHVAECQEIINAAAEQDVKVAIAYYRRTFPNLVEMKRQIDAGSIGRPVFARVQNHAPLRLPEGEQLPWRLQKNIGGGGVLMDIGSHRLDLLRYLLGEVVSIIGSARTVSLPIPVEDSFSFHLRFDSGAEAVGNVNWNIQQRADTVEVFGDAGKVWINNINSGDFHMLDKNGQETGEAFEMPAFTHIGLVENFVKAVKGEEDLICNAFDGLRVNELMADVYAQSKG